MVAAKFKHDLLASGVEVSACYLFGSYSHGTPHPWSDIDIAVVSPYFGKDYISESVLINRIGDAISPLIEAHPLSPEEFADRWSTFSAEIRKGEPV